MARVRIVTVDTNLLMRVLGSHPARVLESDWPDDAKLVNAKWHMDRNVLRLLVESDSFDDVPDGYTAPDWEPTFTEHMISADLVNLINRFRGDVDATA